MTVLLLVIPISLTLDAMNSRVQVRTITIEAKQFEFTPSRITAKLGDTITFILQSNDSRHGFYIQELGIDVEVNVQAPSEVAITLDKTGTFAFLCNVPCGSYHPYMNGKLYVSPNVQHIVLTYILVLLTSGLILSAEREWERRQSLEILDVVEAN
ncbi:MAG: hypothetical protein D6698_13460 [Gammaproteobacteria bacterium]|nr:MAG: hypothetical protein D6698_13460 [Gammaproteobacteria bacterium]